MRITYRCISIVIILAMTSCGSSASETSVAESRQRFAAECYQAKLPELNIPELTSSLCACEANGLSSSDALIMGKGISSTPEERMDVAHRYIAVSDSCGETVMRPYFDEHPEQMFRLLQK